LESCRLTASFSLLFLCLFSSCGYRWAGEENISTLSIPYVKGDEDGSLTTELIRSFASSAPVRIVPSGGAYRLDVVVVEQQDDVVGYRIDPQDIRGKIQKNIVRDEGRRTLVLEVSLYQFQSKDPVFGPVRITADVDYDYVDGDSLPDLTFIDPQGMPRTALAFSLGQLESIEAAQEAATRPLFRRISQKIVDVISTQW
jgi:hypothetical protein